MTDKTETRNALFQVILSNGFPGLRICSAFGVGIPTFSDTWTGATALRTLNVYLKTTPECERLRSICPNLRRLTTYNSSNSHILTGIVFPFFNVREERMHDILGNLIVDDVQYSMLKLVTYAYVQEKKKLTLVLI